VRSATVLPPVFGPVTISARNSPAETDVDRDDPPGEAGVARRQQLDLLALAGPCADAAKLAREARLRRPEVERRECLEGVRERRGLRGDQGGELVEDALLFDLDGQLRLAPRVAHLHRDERLDEQRLAAPRLVVDDAPHPALESARTGTT
jgi:hypothetical protein